jgi:glutamate dehydrogenase
MAGAADRERRRLIAAAERHLQGDDPLAGRLAADLFAHVSLEDLAVPAPEALAGFVRSAASLLQKRMPGQPLVRLVDPPDTTDRPERALTLVEILNDNMPFLVDSVLGELQDSGAAIRLVAHPIVAVLRDRKGKLVAYHGTGPAPDGAIRESLIQVHVGRLALDSDRAALATRLESLLAEIRRAVEDWPAMMSRLREAIEAYAATPPSGDDAGEAAAFLAWIADNNFTFLGAREYDFVGDPATGRLTRAERPGLGLLADPGVSVLRRGRDLITETPAVRDFLMRPEPLAIAKANLKSRIHRRAYMDYVGIKLFAAGAISGELRFVGLFTSTAYTSPVAEIPIVRRKAANVLARAGFDPASHSGKALVNVLEFYPRDELFQIDEDTLFEFAMAILALEERPRIRVLARRDKFDRFVSVLVYVPRDRYDSAIRVRIGDWLAAAFAGRVSAFYPSFPEGPLARVHFIIGRSGAMARPEPDQAALEEAVAAITRNWQDGLAEALRRRFEPAAAERLRAAYADAFPAGYREVVAPEAAIADIETFAQLSAAAPLAGEFQIRPGGLSLRLVHAGGPIPLSVRVPMIENMGFRVIDEQTFAIAPGEARPAVHIHDMVLDRPAAVDPALAGPLLDGFMAVWNGLADNDGYNALVANAGLAWRDIALLRAVSRYLHQAGTAWSQHYMWETLNRHGRIAALLVDLFHARFSPAAADPARAAADAAAIESALEQVASLDEDRIVRRFQNVIAAIVRTNFFQAGADGLPPCEIAFKLDSKAIDGLPAPRPFREIYVASPRLEGIHLRFGRVARGGIRWSDRPADFRTEILGLAKAQQVKNAVIVPVGAKGGFVPKRLPADGDRAAVLAEGTEAYRIFIARLLDLTDNLDGDAVVPPPEVVRADGDDPYLVVAADKGTATFSDTANAIALAHGFWLGDAFASGGSAGYDHKKMGITARGAWEAVKRHFREMDIDIQTTPFTMVGVGDMSGDVFGNAAQLSQATRLVAAFDHRDIFLDPDPDPETSLAERKRLFELPRSSWQDYDRAKLSKGGGIFSRRDKAIPLSAEVKRLLDLAGDRATPQEVIRAILKARVDLLFFGGIGTFVRGAAESDDAVGDRANDSLRVTAAELRARVVGEGANLGMTQRARIEYGLLGGRCNSDAIDNSAGVNTSDVEVNIKIALGRAMRDGRLDLARRNRLLAAMTGEVAELVLRNNYLQTLAISLARRRGLEDFPFQVRLIQSLEGRGLLDRAVETLPDDAALAERQAKNQPLTRAEIGVLLAYAKLAVCADLLAGHVADDTTLDNELVRYFPKRMRKVHGEDIEAHRLRAEIIATAIGNSMINRGGPTYLVRVADRTGASPVAIARAYVAVRDSFALQDLNGAIDGLDNKVPGTVQLDLYRTVEDLVLDKTVWFLRNADFSGGVGPVVAAFGETVATLGGKLARLLPGGEWARIDAAAGALESAGVPAGLARRIAGLPALAAATDIHLVATATARPLADAAAIFFAVGDAFRIARIEGLAARLAVTDYYDGLARDRALEALAAARRSVAVEAVAAGSLEAWLAARGDAAARTLAAVKGLTEGEELTLSRLTVAAGLLADLVRA